jgi:hypothetical protein
LGLPTEGFGRAADPRGADTGNCNFGSDRESENAPLADRCLPTLGLFIAPS